MATFLYGYRRSAKAAAMKTRACLLAAAACFVFALPQVATAQGATKVLSEAQLRELLVWSSPWEGRAKPPQLYSFRTVFRVRRHGLIAETVSYTTNQRSNSVVTVQEGRLSWQDSNGADVNVGVAESGDLVGTAVSAGAKLEIVFKPRP
jgi:hypothetical protein